MKDVEKSINKVRTLYYYRSLFVFTYWLYVQKDTSVDTEDGSNDDSEADVSDVY
jgi:hypothetical protein